MATSDVPSQMRQDPGAAGRGLPPAATLHALLNGFVVGRALHVAAQLGVADLLQDGPRSAPEIAAAVGAHPDTLSRLLRALASVGVFTEAEPGVFALTPLGDCLRSDTPSSLRAFACLFGSEEYLRAFDHLLETVQTGHAGFELAFGTPIYPYLAQHADFSATFDLAMTNLSGMVTPAILAAYDFSDIHTLVDIGGGQGALLIALLRANPAMRGILFDLPHVVEGARARMTAAGLAERCAVVNGTMLAGVPAGADAYLIKNVLMDRDDGAAIVVLRHCLQAMGPAGRLLVIDPVILPGAGPSPAKFTDLVMLILTESGRCRTPAEFQALFEAAGLALTRVIPTPSPAVSIVEGRPRRG